MVKSRYTKTEKKPVPGTQELPASSAESERELYEKLSFFKSLLDNSGVTILCWNLQKDRFEFVSQSVESLTGYSRDEFMGMDFNIVHSFVHPDDIPVFKSALASSGDAGHASVQYRMLTRYGNYFRVSDHLKVVRDSNGTPLFLINNIRNIDDDRKAKGALRQSEEKYSSLIERMQEGFARCEMIFDENGEPVDYRFLDINASFEKIIMLPRQEIIGRTIRSILPGVKSRVIKIFGKVVATGDHTHFENFSVDLDKWFDVHSYRLEQKQFVQYFLDITERKKTEEALRQSRELLSKAFRYSPNAITITRLRDGMIIEGNDFVYDLLGYSRAEVVGKTTSDLEIWPDPADRSGLIRSLSEKGYVKNEEFILQKKDRTKVTVDLSATVINIDGQQCFLCSFTDITFRKAAERAFLSTHQRFYTLLSNMYPGLMLVTEEGIVEFVNQSFCEAYGLPVPGKVIGLTSAELLPMILPAFNDPAAAGKRITEILELMEPVRGEEFVLKNGQTCLRDFVPVNIDGKAFGRLWIHLDITERKKTEDDLRSSLEWIRFAEHAAKIGFWDWDMLTGKITWSNEFYSLFGLEKSETPSFDTFLSVVHPEDRGKAMTRIMQTVDERAELDNEYRIIMPDGSLRWIRALGNTFYDSLGKPLRMAGMCSDITGRKKVEETLLKNEQELRELNATKDKFFNIIAHDLKNPFTSILGTSELLFCNYHSLNPGQIMNLARILNDSAKNGYSLLLNLLNWSRSQTGLIKIYPERIGLKEIIQENISEQKLYSESKQINIACNFKGDLVLFTDRNILNTMLRNIINNGLKYTPKGGRVTVDVIPSEEFVTVSVEDNGEGISEENISNLFRIDSGYQMPGTEKETGTGLGLKLCKEFADKLGGRIWAESVPGKGSRFYFTIPVSRPAGTMVFPGQRGSRKT